MGNFYQKPELEVDPEDLAKLRKSTTLTSGQIKHLYQRFLLFNSHRESSTNLLKRDFLFSGKLHSNPILPLILGAMFGDKKRINFVEFATFLSLFNANDLKTTPAQIKLAKERKLKLLFNMYDTDKDGRISHDDLINIVYRLFSVYMNNSRITEVVNIIMDEMSQPGNDQILFNEFCDAFECFDMDEALVVHIPH